MRCNTSSSRTPTPQPPADAGVGLVLLVCLTVLAGWGIAFCGRQLEEVPPLPAAAVSTIPVAIQCLPEAKASKIYRFPSDSRVMDAINLTLGATLPVAPTAPCYRRRLEAGMSLVLLVQHSEIKKISMGWMPAGQRVALGVPLHPDRMTEADWQVLRGVGPALAQRIEMNRQKYGDFGTLTQLQRVKGIGAKRIRRWRKFF